jgi:solute carrier family 35 protein F5
MSSIWTLVIGTSIGVEKFTFKKLFCVLMSLTGVILISSVDLNGKEDADRGKFPPKTTLEMGIGDGMAFLSAILYGIYTINLKQKVGDESRVNMLLFFGMVGVFNIITLWPGFLVLHFTGIETFQMPPTGKIWAIVLVSFNHE